MNPAPWILDLSKQINSEILGRLSWIGIPTSPEGGSTDCNKKGYSFRLLDYACGEGVISRVYPYPKPSDRNLLSVSRASSTTSTKPGESISPPEW